MMNVELFTAMLFCISLLTGLIVEAIKKMTKHTGAGSKPNILAALVSVVTSVLFYFGYAVYSSVCFDLKEAVFLIALTGASWLSAMLGYDKIIQTIKQIITKKEV